MFFSMQLNISLNVEYANIGDGIVGDCSLDVLLDNFTYCEKKGICS